MERQLAAILAADVVGYSRMIWTRKGRLDVRETHREEQNRGAIVESKSRVTQFLKEGYHEEIYRVSYSLGILCHARRNRSSHGAEKACVKGRVEGNDSKSH